MKKYAVIVAGGSGSRMLTEEPKQFILVMNKPILMHTISRFHMADKTTRIIVVLPNNQLETWKELCDTYGFSTQHKVVVGGKTRFDSVANGLREVESGSLVAIHDGVRPLVTIATINVSFETAESKGSAIAAVRLKDSIRKQEGSITVSKNRNNYFLIQTPQTFLSSLIKEAYSKANESENFTDDASVFEAYGGNVTLIEGNYRNIKITTPEDLVITQALLENDKLSF
jgi:2-C-methyl-D-erythritol 4-phosphate cytidylyltransferase